MGVKKGKQIAKEGDKVLGFDVHVMTVPSGTGTADVPLPHPFMGKLKDKLAKDVKMGSRKCAVKGSVAKHDDAAHMQLPGTIKFQQSPKKEGEVTGGTSAKVKIDGKEAAVIGSTVTTCNDIGARDNSTVMAAGASMPMPAIINPLNTEKWKRERGEAERKEPAFQSVKWAKTSAEEGEEVGLEATVRDIADGNSVTLQVFPEGKGPEDGAAYAKFPVTVRDGAVSARWSYRADGQGVTFTVRDRQTGEEVFQTGAEVRDGIAEAEWTYDFEYNHQNPMKQKPKFSFEVTAQRCKKKESPNVEIGMNHKIVVHDENGEPAKNAKFHVSYSDGTCKQHTSNGQGEIELKEMVPGIVLEITEGKNKDTGLTTRRQEK